MRVTGRDDLGSPTNKIGHYRAQGKGRTHLSSAFFAGSAEW
jgi:hypothetical protein